MVITRTPFRISFFGGGTDYPTWYNRHGGAVLSTTINKYCYITTRYLPPFFNHTHRIRYSKREEVGSVDKIDHPSVRECLKFIGEKRGIEMVHTSDLPAMSGLGSSSAFTVGFLHSLQGLRGLLTTKRQLALDAINVEQNIIKEHVGSQDQTAAAFGGLNYISFGGPQHISVQPVTLPIARLQDLESNLMLYFTGYSRIASTIAKEQIKTMGRKERELHQMRMLVDNAVDVLHSSASLRDFGDLLHETWLLKRGLTSKITTAQIDNAYARARKAGARGGKILGAGGGGFLLLFVEPKRQPVVRKALKDLLYVPFTFDTLGSQIIYYSPKEHEIV